MPGLIPHLLAGTAMAIIGRLYFHTYFSHRIREQLYLLIICLTFSIIPDFFLGLYYTIHLSSFHLLGYYHELLHLIITPLAIIALLILRYYSKGKRKPLWIMGFGCLILHIIMDLFIQEHGVLI
jgi:uncharacterized membrane protein